MTQIEMTVSDVLYYKLRFGLMKSITNLSNIFLFEKEIIISKRRQWNVTKYPLNMVKFCWPKTNVLIIFYYVTQRLR